MRRSNPNGSGASASNGSTSEKPFPWPDNRRNATVTGTSKKHDGVCCMFLGVAIATCCFTTLQLHSSAKRSLISYSKTDHRWREEDDASPHWPSQTSVEAFFCRPQRAAPLNCSVSFLKYMELRTLLREWPLNGEKEVKVTDGENVVGCGGHHAPSCSECPQGHGRAYCNGQCTWLRHQGEKGGQCISTDEFEQVTGCGMRGKIKRLDEENLDVNCGNIHEMRLNRLLGAGDYKEVYEGRWRNGTYAVKITKPKDELPDGYSPLPPDVPLLEASLMQALRLEPNIMFLHGFCNGTLVTEMGSSDNLSKLLLKKDIPTKERLRYALDVAKSVQALHSIPGGPFAHGDLHPGQYVVGERGDVLLGDFDTVSFTGKRQDKANRFCEPKVKFGTHWMSPEQRGGAAIDDKTDVFSLANMIWSLLTGEDFTMEPNQFLEGVRPDCTRVEKLYGREIVDLLEECWVTKPESRPNASFVVSRIEHAISSFSLTELS